MKPKLARGPNMAPTQGNGVRWNVSDTPLVDGFGSAASMEEQNNVFALSLIHLSLSAAWPRA
jgi:hypothetical protein